MYRYLFLLFLITGLLCPGSAFSQDTSQKMPPEDIVQVPAIGKGLCVSNAFQTNMVLQRDKPLNIWGWAEPGEEVTVSFSGQQAKIKAAVDRSWQVTLKPMPANSTPQTMMVKGKNQTLTLENILVGDVWILGGQSNMEFPISRVDDGELEIVSANFPLIRLLTMPVGKGFDSVRSFERLHEWSSWWSKHFRKGDWDICSPEIVREFSGIGYVFGRRLFMASGVPIGLIDTSIGGTTVETWTPQDVLAKIDGKETRDMLKDWADRIAAFDPQADLQTRIANYENRIKNLKAKGQPIPENSEPPSDLRPGPVADRNRPGYCYASVIRPLEGLSVKGAVFHQGFNNCFNGSTGARMYYQVFGKMIAGWRAAFTDAQMPFCTISLCTAGEPQTRENFLVSMYDVGVLIREAQYQTFRDLRDAGDTEVGFVSCFDLRKSWYHPQIKIPAGERAAKWALVAQYDMFQGHNAHQYWLPPSIEKVETVDGTIRLTMSTDIKTRDDSDGKLLGFAIAGKDRRFYPADVQWYTDGSVDNRNRPKYQRNVLVLSSQFIDEPVHYRHAWARNPMSNIVNGRGVSLATQRSDDWLLEETPEKIATPENMSERAASRYIGNQIRKRLELADTERRVMEAEATIAELKPVLEEAQAKAQKDNRQNQPPSQSNAIGEENTMNSTNPTAMARWVAELEQVLPEPTRLPLRRVHLMGPFENAGYQGLLTTYPPEQEVDLTATYRGKVGDVKWQPVPGLEGLLGQATDLGEWLPAEPWSVLFVYAEIEVEAPQIAQLRTASPGMVWAWANGQLVLSPMIPRPANLKDDRVFIALQPGTNQLMFKLHFGAEPWQWEWYCESYGEPEVVETAINGLLDRASDNLTRLMVRYALAEIRAIQGDAQATHLALDALRSDPFATRWDVHWADMVVYQYEATGSFLPLHDVPTAYTPITEIGPHPTFWPQSSPPSQELLVADVSALSPQDEFALSVLQGLVNREQPRLYLLHTRYDRQDRQWLDELHFEGYTSRQITVSEVWDRFRDKVEGALIYDGSIMDEIGVYHSDRLNQTNVLMMIGALEDLVPVTPEMNATLQLPVVFDARGKWASQYEMMRWSYEELFPRMDQRILATNYPGIFLLTDYLVAFKIFTFWFPEHRVLPEENLLRGILASTPPNTPIVGWWFDWMPNPKDPDLRHADAVLEVPGLLRGSAFGKVLTPSHEATNLTVHSGVPVGAYRHKAPELPEFDLGKVYYAYILSDGDNLGEALMMRTRDLQWDRPERGSIPVGWSFAPAAARMAPPVLNYYLRTATPNDLLVGGLGVGYTEPIMYLRAFPEHRETYYAAYTRMTDEAMGWLDTSCLWLINGGDEEEDRYAEGSSGQLQGIFTGYGGSPEMAQARITSNNVAAFRSATRLIEGQPREANIEAMVNDIRAAAGEARPGFIESWVLNWDWRMDMLQEVQRRLGADFVCVRPDVLVQLRQQWEARSSGETQETKDQTISHE